MLPARIVYFCRFIDRPLLNIAWIGKVAAPPEHRAGKAKQQYSPYRENFGDSLSGK